MDPLTAFGLAANVVGFVSFASDLIKTSVEIYSSAGGSDGDVLSLEKVYGDLHSLTNKLQVTCDHQLTDKDGSSVQLSLQDEVKDATVAVKRVAEICRKDCKELLEFTERLHLEDGGGRVRRKWDSFRVALRKAWGQKKVDAIEERLLKSQVTLTLHICVISSKYQQNCTDMHKGLEARSIELQLNQSERFKEVELLLSDLSGMLANIKNHTDITRIGKSDVDILGQNLKTLSISQDLLAEEQLFLTTLQFEARPLRHQAIPEAHERTFRWLLDDEKVARNHTTTTVDSKTNARDGPTLARWLKSKNGIFWVSGKPGSGKSTLMKFVASAPETHEILSQWSSSVIVAAHYFWNSGSMMQKSLEGLLRSLLYDIFRQYPKLIPMVCEKKWEELTTNHRYLMWELSSLNEALSNISNRFTEDKVKFCFFIDGLDEFEGDYDDYSSLCQTLSTLASSPNIKICVSSRPWNVFEEAFGRMPKIYVHELTRDDIRDYAASRLQEHPRWPEIFRSIRGQSFIDEIAERSSGVFLWVFLVTKLLREGMTNRDRFPDLRRRLESFPSELEDFFQRILDSVDQLYHPKMASIFQIALAAKEPLDMFIYDFHDLEYDDEDYFLSSPRLPFTEEEYMEVYERTTYHLNSRTRGLLEISSPTSPVTFLHRTVKDYLTANSLSKYLEEPLRKRSGTKFCPELSILRAYAAWVKRGTPQILERGAWAKYMDYSTDRFLDGHELGTQELTRRLLPYAAQLDTKQHLKLDLKKVLDDIDDNLCAMFSSARVRAGLTNRLAWHPKLFFREHLVDGGVTNYVSSKEKADPVFAVDPSRWVIFQRSLKTANQRAMMNQSKPFNGSGVSVIKLSPQKRQSAWYSEASQKPRKRRRPKVEQSSPGKAADKRARRDLE